MKSLRAETIRTQRPHILPGIPFCWDGLRQNKHPCPRFSSSPLWSILIPEAPSIPLLESLSCTKLETYSKNRLSQRWGLSGTKHGGYQPADCPLVVRCSSAALCHRRGQLYSYCLAPTAENTKHLWLSRQHSPMKQTMDPEVTQMRASQSFPLLYYLRISVAIICGISAEITSLKNKIPLEQKFKKFLWKHKWSWIANAILIKKNGSGGSRLRDFSLYYIVTVLAQQEQKYRAKEQDRKPRDKSMHLWVP